MSEEQEKNKGGCPPVILTDEQKKKVRDLASICTTQQIADYLCINKTTFFEILKRDDEVFQLYKKGRAEGHNFVAGKLMERIQNNDTTAMIFYLKTQSRWKEPTEEREEEAVKIETPEEKAEKLREDRLYMEWRSQRLKQDEKENIK